MDGLRLGSAPSDGRRRQLEMARRVTGDRLEPTARVAARMAAGEAGGDPSERPERRLATLGTIAAAYRTLAPWCALLALATWLAIVSVRRLRRGSEVALIGGCLLLAIAVRLALLAYIDVTSFNGISYRYMAPLHPLLIAFVVLTAREAGRRIAATSDGAGAGDA
jgi:hypothetical protein